MSILKVARMGHPVLRTRARAIDPKDIGSPRIQKLIDDMFETMREYQGVGLAAPQGHPAYRRVCQRMHTLIAEKAGHRAIAGAMQFADHSEVELERLNAERALEKKRLTRP